MISRHGHRNQNIGWRFSRWTSTNWYTVYWSRALPLNWILKWLAQSISLKCTCKDVYWWQTHQLKQTRPPSHWYAVHKPWYSASSLGTSIWKNKHDQQLFDYPVMWLDSIFGVKDPCFPTTRILWERSRFSWIIWERSKLLVTWWFGWYQWQRHQPIVASWLRRRHPQ